MSITELQNKIFTIENPIEIDSACEQIRQLLSGLTWLSHPYHIAQRFFRKEKGQNFIYPETYIPDVDDKNYSYHRLTTDNDYHGMCFFMVGQNKNDFAANQENFLTYNVSIIFSVNLELIDPVKLKKYLFTQELMKSARQLLTNNAMNYDFGITLISETRDLKEVYKEFVLDDLEQYNRAPLQCFRIETQIKIQEEC